MAKDERRTMDVVVPRGSERAPVNLGGCLINTVQPRLGYGCCCWINMIVGRDGEDEEEK